MRYCRFEKIEWIVIEKGCRLVNAAPFLLQTKYATKQVTDIISNIYFFSHL